MAPMEQTNQQGRFSRRSVLGLAAATAAILAAGAQSAAAQSNTNLTGGTAMQLTQSWDKTFPKSDKVEHRKVTFKNRYGITLAADLYLPKQRGDGKLPALAVAGPFGAVKEQSSGLYAQTMAERGSSLWPSIPPIRARVAASRAT